MFQARTMLLALPIALLPSLAMTQEIEEGPGCVSDLVDIAKNEVETLGLRVGNAVQLILGEAREAGDPGGGGYVQEYLGEYCEVGSEAP
jgi:hypothetical protein